MRTLLVVFVIVVVAVTIAVIVGRGHAPAYEPFHRTPLEQSVERAESSER
jgi:hypothetical protein